MDEHNHGIMEQFLRFHMLLHRYQSHNFRNFGPFGNPQRGQGRVLSILKMQPEISQKELGYLLDMRNQSLGELLVKLERSGFITRAPSEKDRRVMNIKLTPEGAEAANGIDDKQADIGNLFNCLSDEEQDKLSEYLERLITQMEQQLQALGAEDDPDFSSFMGGMYGGAPRGHRGDGRGRPPFGRGRGDNGGGGSMPFGGRPDFMPGAERFDPNYGGPRPNRSGFGNPRRGRPFDDARARREKKDSPTDLNDTE